MKKIVLTIIGAVVCSLAFAQGELPEKIILSHQELKDKIKGGWAGQTIGVTFGGPTEFRYNGTFILDYQPLAWYDGYLKKTMTRSPGLYDDIYMDLTFVDVLEREGLDAPVDAFANAFAHAGYSLWHANQAARYNILNGIKAPESGHWRNNPHADDIDYQIESDFAGLMNPGMPNAASALSDKVGHIMNYGDGWYGGVYVGAMYTLAFVSEDVSFIVEEALKTIPSESRFYKCIADVIRWHGQYPDDWKQTWFEIQRNWSEDIGCPEGVFKPFNIDARINAAYIVLGLLYGEGDFSKTMEIATRAGQDSDCNPSSAGGVLGTMLGYSNIPGHWKMGLSEVEDINFKYTEMSLNKVYGIGYEHALEMISRNGGNVGEDQVTISVQTPEAVRFEQSFPDMYPVQRTSVDKTGDISFEFEGTGFALTGAAVKKSEGAPEGEIRATLFIDGKQVETAVFPTSYTSRRYDLFWKYQLPAGKHSVKVIVENPHEDYELRSGDYIVYSDQPVHGYE